MKKSGFIDSVRVDNPCSEDWNEMSGNDKVRFCSHCSKHVNNLSSITKKQAIKLVRRSGGDICIRYIADPNTGGPIFYDQLVQIVRRAPRVAAGVFAASVSLSTVTIAQGGAVLDSRQSRAEVVAQETAKLKDSKQNDPPPGKITGTVVDPVGAVVPAAAVTLLDKTGTHVRVTATDSEGVFEIPSLAEGEYVIDISAPGFRQRRMESTVKADEVSVLGNIELNVGMLVAGGMMISIEYKGELMKAVYEDDLEKATELIAHGADPNGKEDDRTTPLFIAVENGNTDMVRLLLDAGAKVNARNKAKRTPIMGIDDDASQELLDLLFAHGAKVEITDEEGNTPLMTAAEGEAGPDMIKALLTAGSKINAQNKEGMSALMIAADRGDVETVKALLGAGADVNLKDNEGDTAWDHTGDDEIEDLLVAHGYIVPQEEVEQEELELFPPPVR